MTDNKETTPSPAERDGAYDAMSQISKALAHPVRLRLLSMLGNGPKPVEVIARATGQSMSTTSAHLHKLANAGLVRARRHERYAIYGIASAEALALWRLLQATAIQTHGPARDLATKMLDEPGVVTSLAPWREEIALGRVLLVDLRPVEEFMAGHPAHAINVPEAELETRLAEFSADTPIIAYCRGLYCVSLGRGISRLRARGLDVRRCLESVVDWRALGDALESEAEAGRA